LLFARYRQRHGDVDLTDLLAVLALLVAHRILRVDALAS
jgi:hypothetical protein